MSDLPNYMETDQEDLSDSHLLQVLRSSLAQGRILRRYFLTFGQMVRTFEGDGGGTLNYAALADGVFLFDVMTHICPDSLVKEESKPVNRYPQTAQARLANFSALLSFIKIYYQGFTSSHIETGIYDPKVKKHRSRLRLQNDCLFSDLLKIRPQNRLRGADLQEYLGQVLLLSPPDVIKLSKEPEEGVAELRKLLLLVLGCAVQSPIKEDIICNIKQLPLHIQHSIVQCIQEVSDNPETLWPAEWSALECIPEEALSKSFCLLVDHCRRLAVERDDYLKELLKALLGDTDPNAEKSDQDSIHHMRVQFADLKAQLRKLRQEHDEKCEGLVELKEELEQSKETVSRLRQENVDLVQDARSARAWRDEADILRERASRVDSLESDVTRYREKMVDIEFYKTRVEELREDNRILVETKEMLEDQLSTSRRRAELVLDLETTILQLKHNVNQLNTERDADRERLQDAMEENAQLKLSNKNSLSESATLSAQMENLKSKTASNTGGNFGSDLIGDAKTRVLKLELENQRLEAELEDLKIENHLASQEKLLELEKENKRLSIKVTHLQETNQRETKQSLEGQEALLQKEKEIKRLQETILMIRTNSERLSSELQSENVNLHELVQTLRERQKKTNDDRLSEVEMENKELVDLNLQLQSQVLRLEYEKQQLNYLAERLRESAETLMGVEQQKAEIERENRDLHKEISAFRESCEKHEKLEGDYASLEVQFTRVSKSLDSARQALSKLESAQCDRIQLQLEVEKLQRSLESMKSSSMRLADLEIERDQLLSTTNQLKRQMEELKDGQSKVDQLELDLLTANTEIQKLQRSWEASQRKLHDSEKEKGEIEAENTKLQRTVETLRVTTKKLNELERDLTEVEANSDRLERENKLLKKEVERLKGSVEVKDKLVDEASSKTSRLERDNKMLSKELESLKNNQNRTRALEQEKRELEQMVIVERKTLSALREDLISEKVKTQQLSNQLESLTSNLVKLGLNGNNLTAPASDDDDRYKALEDMLEETLKHSIELREEKISSLESRLSESVARNQQIRNQLLQVRSEYESLLQRHQEEGDELSLDSKRQLNKLKELLRKSNEEKTGLENEIAALTSQNASYREQVCALQSQVTCLSNQNTVLSKHNANLQSESAKLQVENTTLQCQSASLIAQNSSLQTSATELSVEKDKMKKAYDERGLKLSQMIGDNEALQKLHEQLGGEYEQLALEHSHLKQSHKELKSEAKTLKDRQSSLSANEDDILKIREALEAEMVHLKNDSTTLNNLRAEHSRLKDDFRSLFTANDKLRIEYKNLQDDYKTIKTENNTLKLKMTQLGGELNDTRDQLAVLDVEATKLTNKCQVLETMNLSLEEDRRSLMSQVSLLLTQYHDLLTQTLEDKQHFHQEEKNFTDKLNNLRRQKEKLEEKIMDQYRRMDNSPQKKRGFGSNLVKRVRKAGNDLINKVPRTGRSRSRGREELDSPDSSSLGSSPANDSLDSGSETRRSSPNLAASSTQSEANPDQMPTSYGRSQQSSSLSKNIDCFAPNSLSHSSVSSEEVPAYTSTEGNSEASLEDRSLPTSELTLVGSRRAVYLAQENNCSSSQDALRNSIRNHGSFRCSPSAAINQQQRNLKINCSTSIVSCVNGNPPRAVTPSGRRSPICSTPRNSMSSKGDCIIGDESRSTPEIPPRKDNISTSAPQLPPRANRKTSVSSTLELSCSSSQSTNGTPESRKKPPAPPPAEGPLKPPPSKDQVDNSVWYEYGCV